MADEAAAAKSKKPMKWYFVAGITLAVVFVIGYFMWPPSVSVAATYAYDPTTGAKLAGPAKFNTNTGSALTS